MTGRIEWASAARVVGWVVGIGLLLGAILRLALSFELFGGPPVPPPDAFIDRVMTYYEFATSQWPIEFVSIVGFAVGFAGLAALGPILGRLASDADARSGLVMAAFLGLGGIGLASQLLQLGAVPFLTRPEVCDCGLAEAELMSREVANGLVFDVQLWLIAGALLLAVPGFLFAGSLGAEAGMPQGWRWLSVAIAVAAIVLAVLAVMRPYPFDQIALGVTAGILVPIWAIWLALRSASLWGIDAEPELSTPMATEGVV
jgi:hypothetical protein